MQKSKKITIIITTIIALTLMALTALTLTGCHAVGTGEMETRSIEATGFTSLRVSGSFIVELQQGDTHSVEVTMQGNLFEFLNIRVSETNQLIIGTRSGVNISTTSANTPRVVVTAPDIAAVSTSGSSRVSANHTITRESFGISTSGSSKIELDLDVTTLDVSTSGSSRKDLNLTATYLNITSSGSSTFNLDGTVTTVDIRTSGSSNINALSLNTQNTTIRASGSARIDIAVATTLAVTISGSARVRYTGSPHITRSISGSGRISPYAG